MNECFRSSEVLKDGDVQNILKELHGRMSCTEWTYWMKTLQERLSPAADGTVYMICGYTSLVGIPYMINRRHHRSRIALQFFEEINSMCLEAKGMHMRPQNGRIRIDKTDYIIPWISWHWIGRKVVDRRVSLTPSRYTKVYIRQKTTSSTKQVCDVVGYLCLE
jgi:hypothetical protein